MKLIVPVLNRFDLLKRMVDSIDVEATVYVINNSGVRQDFEYANELVSMHWVDLPSNLGVASSWNLGIKMLPFESRWFISSADVWFEPGALSLLQTAKSDAVTLCSEFPYWHTFAVGEEVVDKVGLFDEALHPIYFEDNDFQRRCEEFGVRVDYVDLPLGHDNSATVNSDHKFGQRNTLTFGSNHKYFSEKVVANVFDEGRWSLSRRRLNSWD